jgi:hypothetical protein
LVKVFGDMVTMHDLLRDMGREVVCKASPKEPGKRTRIWNQKDAWNVLEQQKVRAQCIHESIVMRIF